MKTLEEITLHDFVEVYFGDFSKLGEGSEEEQVKAAAELCMEYFSIVGGKQVSVQIAKRDKRLRIAMRGSLFDACEQMLSWGDTEGAISVMTAIGYKVSASAISTKIKNLRNTDAYALKKLEESEPSSELTREHFTRERCFIMSHLKMHIDDYTFKAKEYAYLVKQVSDEISLLKEKKRL